MNDDSFSFLGGLLVIEAGVTLRALQDAIDAQKAGDQASISEILLREGAVTSERLASVVSTARELTPDTHVSKALVVDDEPMICVVLTEVLEDLGFDVTTAESAASARAKWEAEPDIALAILDKNLPDGTGLELLKEFKHTGRNCEIALMSGFANVTSAVEAIHHGVSEYFVKPFDLSDLQARLQRLVAVQALRRQSEVLSKRWRDSNRRFVGVVGDAIQLLDAKKADAARERLSKAMSEFELND